MRHAQYRLELADHLAPVAGGVPVFDGIRPGGAALPSITVLWTGTRCSRKDGWTHGYAVEVLADELGPELDALIMRIAERVADWKPNTSAVNATAPDVDPITRTVDLVDHPGVAITTSTIEPRV